MPWCEDCSRLVEDESLSESGACPACGSVLVDEQAASWPWHFKIVAGGTAVYLVYRFGQGIDWLVHHL
jgi:hypothetical protein